MGSDLKLSFFESREKETRDPSLDDPRSLKTRDQNSHFFESREKKDIVNIFFPDNINIQI